MDVLREDATSPDTWSTEMDLATNTFSGLYGNVLEFDWVRLIFVRGYVAF